MAERYPYALVSVTRIGMSRQPQARPATPNPLLLQAAAVPATAVPWPHTSRVSELSSKKFHPPTSFGARSGCDDSTPVSRMAIMTLLLPVVESHAVGASTFGRCQALE